MNSKLTLSVDKEIIQAIKSYASKHGISISKLVENYFSFIIRENQQKIKASQLVQELSGIITLPDDFNEKEEYYNFLNEKHK